MPQPIRFHLDENVDPAIASGLRARGVDVTTTPDAGLLGKDDPDQLAYILREGRVLVTHDDDFLALASRGVEHPGICYCHQETHSVRQLIEMLFLLHECFASEELRNRVEFL
jgi:predicted nuclease of predicted toxin-antitoxin system